MNNGCGPQDEPRPQNMFQVLFQNCNLWSVIIKCIRGMMITISPDFLKNFISIRFYLNTFLGQKNPIVFLFAPILGGFPNYSRFWILKEFFLRKLPFIQINMVDQIVKEFITTHFVSVFINKMCFCRIL